MNVVRVMTYIRTHQEGFTESWGQGQQRMCFKQIGPVGVDVCDRWNKGGAGGVPRFSRSD